MYCILIAGAPASGKSTFARYLSRRLRLPMIAKDSIKEKLFDTVGFSSRDEKRKLDMAATEIMYYLAESDIRSGVSVILDNNFETSSLPSLKRLLAKTGAVPITVRFQGDMDIIYRRFVRRDMSPKRHRGHVVNSAYPEKVHEEYVPMGAEVFKKRYTERGMTTFSAGELITVDCTAQGRIDYEAIILKIREIMGN